MAKKDKKKSKKAGDWSDSENEGTTAAAAATPASPVAAASASQGGKKKKQSAKAKGDSDDEGGDDDVPSMAAASSRPRFNFADLDDAAAKGNGDDDNDDDEEGGLMAAMKKSSAAKKDKKKKKQKPQQYDPDEDLELDNPVAADGDGDDADGADAFSKAPVQMTTEQLMEEEFGETVKPKKAGKKGKKGGKKQQQDDDFDEDEFLNAQVKSMQVSQPAAPAASAAPATSVPAAEKAAPEQAEEDGDGEDAGPKLLTKKEKEKLKKEKEKAKKKAQAAAKKGTGAANDEPAVDAPAEPTASVPEEVKDAADEDEAGGASSKSKKKKKKGGAKEEAVSAPAAAKKVPAHIAALREALEKQKAAEAEARRLEEEERQRIEEEERQAAEVERLKEEEKKRKKEKEKAKVELAKKEGRYMTPKQKADAAAAKARRDAMIASGQIKVEGLQNDGDDAAKASAPKPKKVSYGKKKPQKKGQAASAAPAETASGPPAPAEEPIAVDPTRKEEHEPKAETAAADDAKEDWEASSEDDKPAAAKPDDDDELDDWDASSASEKEEEVEAKKSEVPKKAPAPAVAKTATTAPSASAAAAASKPAATPATVNGKKMAPAPQANGTAKAVPSVATGGKGKAPIKKPEEEEESSEEESSDDDSDDDSDSDSDDDSDSDEERISAAAKQAAERKAAAQARREQQRQDAIAAGSRDNLRSPICCILGHVDTGKTKLLDKIRQTNVQEGEAGGITQQIGATYFPMDTIEKKTAVLGDKNLKEYKMPGLLIIDTPGHESFTNLRTRGSSLCNIAILVVDIMHGLEPQTLESIRLLKSGKTPFIVALNKIDRLYGWKATPNNDFRASLALQGKAVQNEFEKRLGETKLAFAEQGLNAIPYYENDNFAKNVSLVPTSAHTGEGIPDMLMLIIKLTQERMSKQLMYISELECTVLEVKVIEGLGTTLDVVLSNGVLHEGDKIVVCGLNGPIVTQVRALLTPEPMKEMRIKGAYVHHQTIKASMGVKIVAPDLEKAIAGSRLLVVGPDDDEEDLKEEVMEVLETLTASVDKSGKGVYVQASTLGSLEALLEFLRTSKIPVSGINIGPVHKKDITRCAVMLDRAPEFAVVLAFDVPIDKEAEKMADELHIKVFKADIIYHLFDAFTKHNADILEAKRKDAVANAVWPCKLKILKTFCSRDPIIVGCDLVEGSTVRVGTPICVVKVNPETKQKEIIRLGKITSLEINHTAKDVVKRSQVGAGVAVKIEHAVYESAKSCGRHFTEADLLVSMLSRSSIDTLKTLFREDVPKDDWVLIKQMKTLLDIP